MELWLSCLGGEDGPADGHQVWRVDLRHLGVGHFQVWPQVGQLPDQQCVYCLEPQGAPAPVSPWPRAAL